MQEFFTLLALLTGGGFFLYSKQAGAAFPTESQPAAQFSQTDVDTLARTIWGEARGEGYEGMKAVANVVLNRYAQAQKSTAKARQFGSTIHEICTKKYQFSAWLVNDPNYAKLVTVTRADPQFNTAYQIAQDALAGRITDNTRGADHYHTTAITASWSRGKQPVKQIGSHLFYDLA